MRVRALLLAGLCAVALLGVADAFAENDEIPKDVAASRSDLKKDADFLDLDDKYLNINDEPEAFDDEGFPTEEDVDDDTFFLNDDVDFATSSEQDEDEDDDEPKLNSKGETPTETNEDGGDQDSDEQEQFVEADEMPVENFMENAENVDAKPKDEKFMGIWDETYDTLSGNSELNKTGNSNKTVDEVKIDRLGTQTFFQLVALAILALVALWFMCCGTRQVYRRIKLHIMRKTTITTNKSHQFQPMFGDNNDDSDDGMANLLKPFMDIGAKNNIPGVQVHHEKHVINHDPQTGGLTIQSSFGNTPTSMLGNMFGKAPTVGTQVPEGYAYGGAANQVPAELNQMFQKIPQGMTSMIFIDPNSAV